MATSVCQDLVALQEYLHKIELADAPLSLIVGNTCEPSQTREGYFNWTLFVQGERIADRVHKVVLKLHPTFKKNVIVLDHAPFQFSTSGWGTFVVGVEVDVYTDSDKSSVKTVKIQHELVFDNGGAQTVVNVPQDSHSTHQPMVDGGEGSTKAEKTANAVAATAAATASASAAKAATEVPPNLYEDLVAEAGGPDAVPAGSRRARTIANAMHGTQGDASWDPPVKVVHCDLEARPGYASRKAHEYNDTPRVLRAKVALLASMVRKSSQMAAYTGAGISTASGIGDYASKAKNTTSGKNKKKKKRGTEAEPTLAHRVLTALHKAGHLKHWVQQNHDGLPQKAGFPQGCLNEIHGAWQDPSNPVVPMSGHLRRDLVEWLEEWEERADMCLVLGTSMCGMAADDFALAVNKRAHKQRTGLGMAVVSLQQTQHDSKAALRIFAKIDDVMALLAAEFGCGKGAAAASASSNTAALMVPPYTPAKPIKNPHESVFHVDYNMNGDPKEASAGKMVLDLRPGSRVRVTRGVGKGFRGTVRGMTETGDYVINLPLQREGHPQRGKKMSVYIMGRWWIQGALENSAKYLPVVNETATILKNKAGK